MWQNIFQLWEKYLKLVKRDSVCSVSLDYFCSLRKRMTPLHRRLPWGNLALWGGVIYNIGAVSLTLFSSSSPPHRGKEFIINHLRMQDVSCYWEKLLTEYSRLLTYKPRRRNNYNKVVHRPRKTELWGRGMLGRTGAAVVNRHFTQWMAFVHTRVLASGVLCDPPGISKELFLQHSCLFLYKLFCHVRVCLWKLKVS